MNLNCWLAVGIVVAFYTGCFVGAMLMQNDMARLGFRRAGKTGKEK